MLLRAAGPDDVEILTDALLQAANWDGQTRFTRALLLADSHLSSYVRGWPRAGDFGTVATDEAGAALGAAWCRRFDASDPGYGFVGADVPELSIGVDPHHRGRGVGTALLNAVLRAAAERELRAVSLSVEDGNPARTLYERAGFAVVGRSAGSAVMLVRL